MRNISKTNLVVNWSELLSFIISKEYISMLQLLNLWTAPKNNIYNEPDGLLVKPDKCVFA